MGVHSQQYNTNIPITPDEFFAGSTWPSSLRSTD